MAFISNGTTILDNGAFSVSLGSMVLLSEQTASASASISFTSGIDSTYPIYKFEFINIHPSVQNANPQFNFSTDGGSNYNVTKTSTAFRAYHFEGDLSAVLEYQATQDLAQSSSYQNLTYVGNDNDMSVSGSLKLFSPSSTTYVKHFLTTVNTYGDGGGQDLSENWFTAGYGNTTSAINAIRFQMSSGNIDAGTIKLYGIKDS
jgi:hypothetical protein